MSAIAGLLHKTGKLAEAFELERMSVALEAYGPDGGGVRMSGPVGILQQHGCFTPEDRAERQPLLTPDRQVALVCAARIDNRAELTREFGTDCPNTPETPDSAFIMAAYLRWDRDFPQHLIGDYTVAVWNEHEQSLFLAVSPLSARTLYYHESDDLFAFASVPRGLFSLRSVPRELDEEYLVNYLSFIPRPPDSTYYRGIFRLQSGHRLVADRQRMDIRAFWELDVTREIHCASDDEYEEAFLAVYTRAVRDHLRSVTPVGLMMSGGLDSSSIAALAAPLLKTENRRLAAFTQVPRLGFELPAASVRYADETPLVQAIADMYDNIDLNLVRADGHFLREIDRYFHHSDFPFPNASNRPWFEACLQAARVQGIGVMLWGGTGGNITISWKGDEPMSHLVRQGRWGEAMREARVCAHGTSMGLAWRTLLRQGVMPNMPAPFQQVVWRWSRWLTKTPGSRLQPSVLRGNHARRGPANRPDGAYAANHSPKLDSRSRRRDALMTMMPGSSRTMAAYQGMFGVEMRDPSADVRVVEFCLTLPEDQFRRDGVSRRLIRRAMANRLPADIVDGWRRGAQAADWRLNLLAARDELHLALERMAVCDVANRLIDFEGVGRALDRLSVAPDTDTELRSYVDRGLMMGSFVRWFVESQQELAVE